jgi:hypothetical protein
MLPLLWKGNNFVENMASVLNANGENSFLQRMGLLKRTVLYTPCNCSMTWCIYNKIKDKYIWKCMTEACQKYKTTHFFRSGSMLEDCRVDLNRNFL